MLKNTSKYINNKLINKLNIENIVKIASFKRTLIFAENRTAPDWHDNREHVENTSMGGIDDASGERQHIGEASGASSGNF